MKCKFCDKELNLYKAIIQHEIRCNNNPNKILDDYKKTKEYADKCNKVIPETKCIYCDRLFTKFNVLMQHQNRCVNDMYIKKQQQEQTSICSKCGIEFLCYGKAGIKKFCSSKCSHSRIRTPEINNKVSLKLKGKLLGNRISIQKRKEIGKKCSLTWKEKLLSVDFDSLSLDSKKRRVILEQNHKCLICEISEWVGKSIQLAVYHKDGNNKNNLRENLRGLCPNCHSQTTTYCGRNTQNRISISDEQLLDALLKNSTISATLDLLGKSRTSYYYQRCYRLIDKYKVNIN